MLFQGNILHRELRLLKKDIDFSQLLPCNTLLVLRDSCPIIVVSWESPFLIHTSTFSCTVKATDHYDQHFQVGVSEQ